MKDFGAVSFTEARCLSSFTLMIYMRVNSRILGAGDDIWISCHQVKLNKSNSCQWQQPHVLQVGCWRDVYLPVAAGMQMGFWSSMCCQMETCPPPRKTTHSGCCCPRPQPFPLPWGWKEQCMCRRKGEGGTGSGVVGDHGGESRNTTLS